MTALPLPATSPEQPGFDAPLGFMLVEAARLYRARMDQMFEKAGLGLTAGEARTLAYVNRHPGLRQHQLALEMNVEPMTLVGFLDRLEGRGLVTRQVDPADRRAKIITLTPEAPELVARIGEVGKQMRKEILGGLEPQEQGIFIACLRQLTARLSGNETGAAESESHP